jgi:hypothetical protein
MRNVLWLSLCLLMSPLAHSHDAVVSASCLRPNTAPILISTFSFSTANLQNYRAAAIAACTAKLQTCGGVDEYHYANRMAQEYCAALTPNAPASDKAQASVSAPSIFNSQGHSQIIHGALKHHEYGFSSGLSGSCYVCPLATD